MAPSLPRGLSHRYITDRQLPDKAIDLIDEAGSRIRMEIDSMPEEMDRLDRRLIQLKMEREALRKEDDDASRKRLEKLEDEIDELEKQYADLEEIWQAEKAALQGAAEYKAELEQARVEMEQARRAGDLSRMSELQYGQIPELEKKVKDAQDREEQAQAETQLLRNKVTDEELLRWWPSGPGFPCRKCWKARKTNCCAWKMPCTTGWSARTKLWRPWPTRCVVHGLACRTRTGPTAVSCSWAPPGWARRNCARRWRIFCSTPKRPWCASTCPSSWRSTLWRGWSVRLRGMWVMKKVATSPNWCGANLTRWCCWMKWKKPTRMCSTFCCRCWMMVA